MERYLLITGLIAQRSLAKVIKGISQIDLKIKALPCTVAALMSTEYIARELVSEEGLIDEVIIIPGLCQGSLQPIIEATGCQVIRGPKDLFDLPLFFQSSQTEKKEQMNDYKNSPIKILAEIVNAPRMSQKEIMEKAYYFIDSGADIIDLGGDVNQPFPRLHKVIQELKNEGFKVSIDSHQKEDILEANKAGADLILSFTSHNIKIAKDLDCKVVLIPDDCENLDSLYRNMEKLERWNISYLVDPILPPLTMGLAKGIGRYLSIRKKFPNSEMLMGLGNVTELIDADSTGINALLTGIAGELGINYILTTEVSHRARGAVREINLARGLIHRAIMEDRVPKHLEEGLLTIKDPSGNSFGNKELKEMQLVIRDKNYRIFVNDQINIFNAKCFFQGTSAQDVFSKLDVDDPDHAFYLGRELAKAELALQLGKKYVQDYPLRWGYFDK
ncbi:MAG: DUF4346 domain-containing protein [Peptococcaceae bacterium]|nr:DUF4346 domain-containing protein [Peptococcaceae bacterium]